MRKPQITVKIDRHLLQTFNQYAELKGTSKTDLVISAISHCQALLDRAIPELAI